MYEREDIRALIKIVEAGVLKLGKAGGVSVCGELRWSGMMHLLRQRAVLDWSELSMCRMDDLGNCLAVMRRILSWWIKPSQDCRCRLV